ncbi:NUDIX hydrolase [Litorimonas sp. WD9-15]|uniref:NUDIX hydrolase n=1 Tax=Litorimonas sp. WD9-15 TaxID=3418716 RepID=UPI003D00DAF0
MSIVRKNCVGVVCIKEDSVLLIQRGTAPRKGEWSIPGGRIEPGETEAEASLRELSEETDVTAELLTKITVLNADFEGFQYRLHDYLARWTGGEPRAGDDAAQARFVPLSEIDALGMWPETVRVIREGYAKMALFSGQAA